MQKQDFYYLSENKTTNIHAICWKPEGEVKAVLQIIHGMAEYIDRYHAFATFLAERGILVVGHDHLGHGKSVTDTSEFGYFYEPDGNRCVIRDIHQLRMQTQKQYQNVPYFMMGHSMGSFLLRQYLGNHAEGLSGAVIMGTGDQPAIALKSGKLVCKILSAVKGWHHRSKFVNSLAVGAYEKKLGLGWLSVNQENVDAYAKDPLCGFVFTVNGFYHMFDGMERMNRQENSGTIPKELPLFFVAGEEDPVGNFGKGVVKVFERYKNQGAEKVSLKLYPKDRHEILNETDREQVYEDLFAWMME